MSFLSGQVIGSGMKGFQGDSGFPGPPGSRGPQGILKVSSEIINAKVLKLRRVSVLVEIR